MNAAPPRRRSKLKTKRHIQVMRLTVKKLHKISNVHGKHSASRLLLLATQDEMCDVLNYIARTPSTHRL